MVTGRGGDCTSGYSVHSATGINYLVTAGHCFATNEIATNLGTISNGTRFGDGTTIGRVTNSNLANPANGYRDVAFINVGAGNSQGKVYSGGYWENDSHRVAGAYTNPSFARTYCLDGAYSYERCGLKINPKAFRQCRNFSTGRSCDLIAVENPQGTAVAGNRDSGGPAYYKNEFSGDVYILGHIVGGNAPWAPCQGIVLPDRICSAHVWVAFVGGVINAHHVTVDIGIGP
jgi:hypothetical protein